MKHLLSIILLFISFLPSMANKSLGGSLKDTLQNFDATQNYFTVEKRIDNARILKVDSSYMDVQLSYPEDVKKKMGRYWFYRLCKTLVPLYNLGNRTSEITDKKSKKFFKKSFDLSQTEYDKVNKILADSIQWRVYPFCQYSKQFYALEDKNEKYVLVTGTLTEEVLSAALFFYIPCLIYDGGEIQFRAVIRLSDGKVLKFMFNNGLA